MEPLNILICHPEATMRHVLRRMITSLSRAAVLEADSREVAVKVIAQSEIAAIIIDSRMLAGPGEALLTAVSNMRSGLPVLILPRENWRGQVAQSSGGLTLVSSLYELQEILAKLGEDGRSVPHHATVARPTAPSVVHLPA